MKVFNFLFSYHFLGLCTIIGAMLGLLSVYQNFDPRKNNYSTAELKGINEKFKEKNKIGLIGIPSLDEDFDSDIINQIVSGNKVINYKICSDGSRVFGVPSWTTKCSNGGDPIERAEKLF